MLGKTCLFVGIFTLLSLGLAMADPPATHPLTGEPLIIDCLWGTPNAIDGDLSDWNLEEMTPAILDVAEQLNSGATNWDSADDLSGKFYLLWDDAKIYMAVVVKDDTISTNKSGDSIWNSDCAEVFFSTINAVAGHAEHYQYGFNANEQRWIWDDMEGGGSREPSFLQVASATTADGYICEVSIEYGGMLSLDWTVGSTIGFHPALDDTDSGDREIQMTWTSREAHDQSQGYGYLILSSEAAMAKEVSRKPIPEIDAGDVLRDSILSWTPGAYAVQHNLYLGDSFEDVNSATVATAEGLDINSFDPGRLEFGKTYFWRVDEVNGTPDKTVFKGNIWNFTAEPYSIQIPGTSIATTASSYSTEFSLPENTINGSGLGADDAHSTASEAMWFTAPVDLDPWIQYEFDGLKKLDIMKVWNSNSAAETAIGWSVKDVVIEYSVDGENWDVLEGANQFSRAPGSSPYTSYDEIDFGGVAAQYVHLGIQSNWGGMLMSYSLSEVQFMEIPAAARQPVPDDGSGDVLPNAIVTWRAGREADTHTIYLGTDPDAVADASAPSVSSNTNSLDLSALDIDLDETYFWRVDEVNEAEAVPVWAGPVWRLSTPLALMVDDFESYSNVSPNRPFQHWLDAYGYSADEFFPAGYGGNGTSAGIGHDIWTLSSPHYSGDIMETESTVNGSGQSMPFYYTNSGGVVSETQCTFATPQDWTLGDVKILSVAFRGTVGNTGSLYIKINDTKVLYQGSALSIERPVWTIWSIDLAATGASLSNVTGMAIGMDGGGASGMVLIDDIQLHAESFAPPTSSDITTPGDAVQGVPNDDDWPTAESPDLAFDDNTATKYLHRKGGAMATGFQVTPMVGATVVTGLTLTTANDVPNRDPITFELSGSNTSVDGPYQLIASGDVVDFAGATEWPRFTQNETEIEFGNTAAYTYYQIVFPTLRGASESLMQIAEVELIGTIQ